MSKYMAIFCLQIIISWPLMADETLDSFILSAENDAKYLIPDTSISRVQGLPVWLDSAEVRLKADATTQSAYALRLRPKSGGERSAEQAIFKLHGKKRILEYESALNDALLNRYLSFLNIIEQRLKTDYTSERLELTQSNKKWLRNLVQTAEFSPEALQKVELENVELKAELDINNKRLDDITANIGFNIAYDTYLSAPADWLLPISDIEYSIANVHIVQGISPSNHEIRFAQMRLRLAREELQRTTRQGKSLINFFELESSIQNPNDFGVTVGFSLPLGGKSSNVSKRERGVTEAKTTLRAKEREIKRLLEEKKSLLWLSFDIHKATENTLMDIERRLSRLPKANKNRLIRDLERKQLSTRKQLQEVYLQAMRQYIRYLHVTGQLAERPLRNWIRAGTPELRKS